MFELIPLSRVTSDKHKMKNSLQPNEKPVALQRILAPESTLLEIMRRMLVKSGYHGILVCMDGMSEWQQSQTVGMPWHRSRL